MGPRVTKNNKPIHVYNNGNIRYNMYYGGPRDRFIFFIYIFIIFILHLFKAPINVGKPNSKNPGGGVSGNDLAERSAKE